jgi:hypothetical protein
MDSADTAVAPASSAKSAATRRTSVKSAPVKSASAKSTVAKAAAAVKTAAPRRAPANVRLMEIPQRRQKSTLMAQRKRAAVVLRRGMNHAEFRQIEARLEALDLVFMPILAERRGAAAADGAFCGLIITGGDRLPSPKEREMIADTVQQTVERKAPVLALSDAVEMVLDAAGFDPAKEGVCAVLIHRGVRELKTPKEVDEAIAMMAASPMR